MPLSSQVRELLEEIRQLTGRGVCFPGRNDAGKPMSEASINQVIKRIGYDGKATGRFRHTMSTILHEQGYNTAWIETQLAHVDKNSIRGTYNHAQYLDGPAEMLQWYADYMAALENGEMWCMARSENVPDWMHRQYIQTIVDLGRRTKK